jgi:hypothetical protein
LVPDPARSRFLVNVGSNVCYVSLNTALMVWYVPFLMHRLGVAAYGMIPLANSLVMYAAIISTSLNVSINRFMAIDLNRDICPAHRAVELEVGLASGPWPPPLGDPRSVGARTPADDGAGQPQAAISVAASGQKTGRGNRRLAVPRAAALPRKRTGSEFGNRH